MSHPALCTVHYAPAVRAYSAIATAVATLSESSAGAIGMRTRRSTAASAAGDRPSPSDAEEQREHARGRANGRDGRQRLGRRLAASAPPSCSRPRAAPSSMSGHGDASANGSARTAAIDVRTVLRYSGSAQRRTEEHRPRAESERRSKDAAEVVGIADGLEHDEWVPGSGFRGSGVRFRGSSCR